MGWTSANLIDPQYNRNQTLFVGTQAGCVKELTTSQDKDAFMCGNFHDIFTLTKESVLKALVFTDDSKQQMLVGRLNGNVEICGNAAKGVSTVKGWNFKGPANIVDLIIHKDNIVAGMSDGRLQCLSKSQPKIAERTLLKTGDCLSRLRQCPSNCSIVATGGKDRQNNLKIWDLSMDGHRVFTSKNLPHDHLQLEVPIWDSDLGFLQSSQSNVATCSRYGYVRVYDTRKQRRPVLNYTCSKGSAFCSLATYDHFIYTGCTTGEIRAFDSRQMKNFLHTYKGAVGSISDLCLTADGKFLASSSLDRYVRIHETTKCHLMYQCYVKLKATHVLLRENDIKVFKEREDEKIQLPSREQSTCQGDGVEYDEATELKVGLKRKTTGAGTPHKVKRAT